MYGQHQLWTNSALLRLALHLLRLLRLLCTPTLGCFRLPRATRLRFYGTAPCKAGVVSFLVDGVHPYDLGTLLDQLGIAVRTGHHCTEPLMDKLGIPGTVRASFGAYNTVEEIDRLADAVERAVSMLR